jgi:hypothetical protein
MVVLHRHHVMVVMLRHHHILVVLCHHHIMVVVVAAVRRWLVPHHRHVVVVVGAVPTLSKGRAKGWPCTRISQSNLIEIKITLVNHLKNTKLKNPPD